MRAAEIDDTSNLSEYQGCGCNGHPISIWPGWQNFDSRASVQTDIMPLPISPVHFQQWPGMQFQLSNGWQLTNYGEKASYDDYLRMLYSSTSSPRAPGPMPGDRTTPYATGLVSQKTIRDTVFVNRDPQNSGGGLIRSPIGPRTFYG